MSQVLALGQPGWARYYRPGDMERRLWHRCGGCGRPLPSQVRRCSTRTCPEFAPIWARDQKRRLLENLRLVRLSVMFSVTAPGSDLYPFDPRWCSHSPSTRCSGRIGCRVHPGLAAAFNSHAGGWWSELHVRSNVPIARQGTRDGCSRASGRSSSADSRTSTELSALRVRLNEHGRSSM